jgi:hypothetical protein
MGRCQDSNKGAPSASGRRLGWRICLRKGCGRRYRARQWNQRYCREPECLEEVRRWQARKRQRQRRAAPEGRKSHAEAERARRQRSAAHGKPSSRDSCPPIATAGSSRAWSRSKAPLCDRPGCYEPPRDSRRAPSAYCSDPCRGAMRQVKDRERKWLVRNTKGGQRKRRLEYHAAAKKRLPLPGANPGAARFGGELAGGRARIAVGGYRCSDKAGVPLPQSGRRGSPGVAHHDSQTGVDGRPRAPPAP